MQGASPELPRRTRVVHVRDEHDVYIGRAMPGHKASEFCNPFRIGVDGNRTEVLGKFRAHLQALLATDPYAQQRLEQLRGLTLGCWCKPADCHGDVIVELLDGVPPPPVDEALQLPLF